MALTLDERRRYWVDADAAYAALQADPDGWAEYQSARQSWDSALSQGRKRGGDGSREGTDAAQGRSGR